MKIPKPWGNNSLDRKFKDWLEEIRQFIVDVFNKTDKDYKRVNKRVSNLVISSCEDNDNEVKDARTDIDGTLHDSLYDRLASHEQSNRSEFENQTQISADIDAGLSHLSEKVDSLYDSAIEVTSIYVSQENGDDRSGDGTEEAPFKTVQKAIDSMPVISMSSFFIILDKGVYKENVVISNKMAVSIEIRAYNTENVSAADGDTGVYLRSIKAVGLNAYLAIRGVSQIDHKNGPLYFIYADLVNYVALDNLSIIENTKTLDGYNALRFSGSTVSVYGINVSNQKSVLLANNMSQVNCGLRNTGSGNINVLTSSRSIIYKHSGFLIGGTTVITKTSGGQVFE